MNFQYKIKTSNRGLTFSFNHKYIKVATYYKYVISNKSKKIFIIKSEDKNGLKVSRKKIGNKSVYKSLIDLRNKKIKNTIKDGECLNIKLLDKSIIVEVKLKNNKDKTSQTIIKKINIASLFSGCGMLDYPFYLDDFFEIKIATDIMKDACMSYRENIGKQIKEMDIYDFKLSNSDNIDLVIGGIPCTPFSNANRSKDRIERHKESDLVIEYIRIVTESGCKVFGIENVPSFITAKNGFYYDTLKECLNEFNIKHKIMKDCDYGGYTIRKRVFIVGSIIGEVEFEKETNEKHLVKEALSKVTSDWYNFNDITKCKESSIEKMKYIPQGGNFKDIPEPIRGKGCHSNRYRRLNLNDLCCTLTNFRKSKILHPLYNRILSVAEALALSGFDKNFKVVGSLNNKQQQVANGVPFALGNALKNTIKNIFIKYQQRPCLN